MVLLAIEGLRDAEIARRLGVSRQTVGTWRHRWQSAGLAGLEQRPRTGRPATVDEAEVVARALLAPGGSGASRAIARELGLSHATVASIRRRWAVGGDITRGPRVPARPPLPGADIWVMGVYVDDRRAVLLAGTRPDVPPSAAVATVLGEDVLSGLAGAMDALHPGGSTSGGTHSGGTHPGGTLAEGPRTGADHDPELAGYLAEATAHHPDIALHAVTLWDSAPADAAPADAVPAGAAIGGVTSHRLPANASWRSFLRAMAALDSTSHPESSRRVYLDLVAELGRGGTPVRWLRENVAGHLRSSAPVPPAQAAPSTGPSPANAAATAASSSAAAPAEPIASSGVNQIDLGSFNECVVIESVRLSGTITRGEIAHRTGLTQQSVSRIARSLIDRGILVEDAQRRATSGKPRTPVRLCGTAAHALGLHIDPEVLTAVVIDLDGAIVCTCTRPVGADTDPTEFVAQVVALGREALEKAQGSVPEEGFLGIGVAVPGPVDIASGTVLGPPLLSAWNDIPLLYLLKDHFPCPVIIEKDSLAAAAGERWIGRDRRARDFAYLYLGTGVGSGLYLNGDLYRGVSANAGSSASCARYRSVAPVPTGGRRWCRSATRPVPYRSSPPGTASPPPARPPAAPRRTARSGGPRRPATRRPPPRCGRWPARSAAAPWAWSTCSTST